MFDEYECPEMSLLDRRVKAIERKIALLEPVIKQSLKLKEATKNACQDIRTYDDSFKRNLDKREKSLEALTLEASRDVQEYDSGFKRALAKNAN